MTRVHWISLPPYDSEIAKDAVTYSRHGMNPYAEWVLMFNDLAPGDQEVYNYPLLF